MALLNKAKILAAQDDVYEDVPVPEWGGEVRIRGLSGIERDKYEKSLVRMRNGQMEQVVEYATARLVAWAAVDENNSRIFQGEDEVKQLAAKSSVALQRCFNVAARLAGLTQEDIAEMTEGFGNAPSGSSTSA